MAVWRHSASLRRASRAAARAGDEAGFTLVEMIFAAVIFVTVATGVVGVLSSAMVSHTSSRERTRAEEIGQAQIERIRTLPYASVGTVSGNPPGTVPAAGWNVPSGYAVEIDIADVTDPGASSYNATANYRKVVATVTRSRDGKRLAQLSTMVAPTTRSSLGGISGAALTVRVKDWALTTGVTGATVNLTSGPSPNRSDTSDANGEVAFLALLPTNTSPPGDFYDVAVTKAGYQTYADDLPPASPAHLSLAPSEVATTTIRIFKPATIDVAVKDAANDPYTLPATVKILSARTNAWSTFSLSDPTGTLTVTSLSGEPVYPNVRYTVRAYTPTGLCGGAAIQNVPDDYPTVMSSTINVPLSTCPGGTVAVNVKQLGFDIPNANVTLAGGPYDVTVSGTTDANGDVVFTNVPSGADTYTVSASRVVQGVTYSATDTVTVSTGATSNVALALDPPALATVNVTLTAAGVAQSAGAVVLSGSPFGFPDLTATTNASGVATFTNVPAGTGYGLTGTQGPYPSATGTATVAAPTTNAALTIPTVPLSITTNWAGKPASSASVSITDGINTFTGTTSAAGGISFNLPQNTWNATVSKGGFSGTGSVALSGAGGSLDVTNFPTATIVVNATWASVYAGGAAVSITGGANSGATYTGSTGSADGVLTITVPPRGTGTAYTVSVSKSGGSGSASVPTLGAGGSATANVALTPTKSVQFTIQAGGVTQASKPITLSITGGPNGTTGTPPVYGGAFTTNTSGRITLTLPSGSGIYTVKAYSTTCAGTYRSLTTTMSAGASPVSVTLNMLSSTCPPSLP